jgi:hypothetical protein
VRRVSAMADDPGAREIGRVSDGQGHVIIIGIEAGTVTLRTLSAAAVTLTSYRAEEFSQLYISACWQAGWHQGHEGRGLT